MVYCPICKSEKNEAFADSDGKAYEVEDDLNEWSDHWQTSDSKIIYASYICNDCGNFFAIGERTTRRA